MAETSKTPLPRGSMVDHYRVLRPLGRGTFGEVHLARDTTLQRNVALKLLNSGQFGSKEAVDRFLFEARATARFSHPNIVAIYGVGQFDGSPYVALEYVEGQTLRERLATSPPSPEEVVELGLSAARALQEAHRRNILHCDLKPENVMLARDGRLRLFDFGLAMPASSRQPWTRQEWTRQGDEASPSISSSDFDDGPLDALGEAQDVTFGTPEYMAPEQWLQNEPSSATDIWALGVMLYELLSGTLPYDEPSIVMLAVRICSPDPVPPLSAQDLPEALRRLVNDCLCKDPEQRPTAEELAERLEGMTAKPPEVVVSAAAEEPARVEMAVCPALYGARYLLLERIHLGGASEVFRAAVLGSQGFEPGAAVKRILPHLAGDTRFAAMFLEEARLSARLRHPHICRIDDYGNIDGAHYLAMEYVAGQTLRELQRRCAAADRRIPREVAIRLVYDLCSALDHVHAHGGIVHRDVTPENLLISYEGELKLIDFGTAKAASRVATTTTGLKGTWYYMAPEQLDPQGSVDSRTDLFTAGLVLHELLTGQRVYPKAPAPVTLERVRKAEIPPPSEVNGRGAGRGGSSPGVEPALDPELDAVVMRALARDPGDRYDSARELQQALERCARCGDTGVASLMREHFAEEIEREQTVACRDAEVCAEHAGAAASDTPPEGPKRRRQETDEVERTGQGARRGWLPYVVIASLSILVGAGGVALLLGGQDHRSGRSVSAAVKARPTEPAAPPTPDAARRAPAALHVTTVPAGADLELRSDGASIKTLTAPARIDSLLPGGRYLLRASKKGHIPVEREIVWSADSSPRITLTLSPLPP
jgi:serine/threonine protein kinase